MRGPLGHLFHRRGRTDRCHEHLEGIRASALMPDAPRSPPPWGGSRSVAAQWAAASSTAPPPAGYCRSGWLSTRSSRSPAWTAAASAASEFWTGYRQNAMQPNELLVAVHITLSRATTSTSRRSGLGWHGRSRRSPRGRIRRDGEQITEARVAWVRWPLHRYGPDRQGGSGCWRRPQPADMQRCHAHRRHSSTLTTGRAAKRIVQSWIGQCLKQP